MAVGHCVCGACRTCTPSTSDSVGGHTFRYGGGASWANYGNDAILERLDRIIALLEGMDCECDNDEDEDSVMHDLREDHNEWECLDCKEVDGGICLDCCERVAEGIWG